MLKLISVAMLVSAISNSNQEDCLPPLKECSRDKVSFYLYTGAGEQPQELILGDPTSLKNAIFNKNTRFKFIVHGFTQGRENALMVRLRDEYFKSNRLNLIYIDWQTVATEKCYMESAVPSAPKIGECAASLLKQLFEARPEITIDKFHFIGFSLGAQICAQISNNLQPLRIPRITGCDPALTGSFFGTPDTVNANTLNRQHADFVDAILTNMGLIGVSYSSSHYDMYASNGDIMPGCSEYEGVAYTLIKTRRDTKSTSTDPDLCSHARAMKIFIESINSPIKFIAVKCDDKDEWIKKKKCTGQHQLTKEVGEYCSPPQNENEIGIYHFYINPSRPLAIAPAPLSSEKCYFDRILKYFKGWLSYLL